MTEHDYQNGQMSLSPPSMLQSASPFHTISVCWSNAGVPLCTFYAYDNYDMIISSAPSTLKYVPFQIINYI